ncbi:MAG: proton-conducting transporter membrane subunit [Methylotenera sp.]|nr:proton-conducting transporter membrane subunit [Methylotenera sp.]MDO9233470.1 proton-conducting transporter membrane subunit [Methylotenera sp.]MDO9389131.1 proton-conducting transporter membrane subunit [Methylotenera sp.]MDP2403239.1 proton-conducting transporter membrane subunit [Methylotenera sp.]MDP3095259.1 proton-conducting transporter membrane subunit [Methylotenera sp.]
MQSLMPLYVFVPLLGFFLSLFFSRTQERAITSIALTTVGLHFILIIYGVYDWATHGMESQNLKYWLLFEHEGFRFILDFYFDRITAVFALVGAFITLLVIVFSQYYMHRDDGFKRYFNSLLLFYVGYSFAIFAGNFETLFIGWEIFGFTSFLLIGYYRDRYLPVKNAFKVLSLYRLGDVCLILAMWMAHHIFHTNITFTELAQPDWLNTFNVDIYAGPLLFIVMMVLIAAAVKSAQFPFSSWLPRAMEGPTTSSAIFYGALSAHLGVFLLLRTSPLWQAIAGFDIAIILLGFVTALFASMTAKVQSTIKTQIAYGAITQMGLMLIEIGMGWHGLALVHFAGHACLRAYQLLVSPSTLGYMIHNQFFEYEAKPVNAAILSNRLRNSLYMLSIKEWHLDTFQQKCLWLPFKWLGKRFIWLETITSQVVLMLLIVLGIMMDLSMFTLPAHISQHLPLVYATLSLMCILAALASRGSPMRAWWKIIMSQLLIVLAVSLNVHVESAHVWIYLTTTISAAVMGMFCLHNTYHIDKDISLNQYHGYVQERPDLAIIFLICSMALVGFPFTPTFIAIDLMFTQIHAHQYGLVALTGVGFIFLELAALRIYARVYLGPHKKHTHPIAYRSS